MKRYKVVTTEGYSITGGVQAGGAVHGLTASVLDTKVIHREVARFRSEDRGRGLGRGRRGIEGAKQAAQDYADMLNARCERT